MGFGRKAGSEKFKIGGNTIEGIEMFNYFRVVSSTSEREMENRENIMSTNKAFYASKKLLKNKILRWKTK